MKRLIALALAACLVGLSGCNTIQGLGRDIETMGESIQKKAR